MKLRLLCLDDELQTLHEPLRSIFNPILTAGNIPNLSGGLSQPFMVNGFGENQLEITITSNRSPSPDGVVSEIQEDFSGNNFDIVLIDDNWGAFGRTAGQTQLFPSALSLLSGGCPELPVFVLFTQHWDQVDRVKLFCDLMGSYPDEQHRVTGIHKNDISGLMILIQRVVIEKRIIDDCIRLDKENKRLQEQLESLCPRPMNIIGESSAMRNLYGVINQVAPTSASVLISGECGTGKELFAKAIHANSQRKEGPFIAVNCAAIPDSLLESELFGYEKGAFTGATTNRKGKVELADGGTILLDEISEMPLLLQAKLLRAIQERQVDRVGGTKPVDVDIRIIATTNRDLQQEVREGRFRKDLYYRLNVIPIQIPPLRERAEDINLLSDSFIQRYARENNRTISFSKNALFAMNAYNWPGNVRELDNVIQRVVILSHGEEIHPEHLPPEVREVNKVHVAGGMREGDWCPSNLDRGKAGTTEQYLNTCEEIAIKKGKLTQADLAKEWDISRPAVTQKIKKYGKELRALLEWPANKNRWPHARNFVMGWDAVRSAEKPE